MIVIKNCNLWTMANDNDINADIIIDGKKIIRVGKATCQELEESTVIDAKNHFVMPGIVDPHSHIGIGQNMVKMGYDYNEVTNPITPECRGFDAIKDCDEAWPSAIRGGITTVCPGPGSANLICGTFAALKTYGKTVEDKVIKEDIAMKMALGENPKMCYGNQGKAPMTRMAQTAMIRDALTQAKKYKASLDAYNKDIADGKEASRPPYNQKWESLKQVFEGMKVKIHAHQAEDILNALRIVKEFNLDATIEHCTSGWTIPEKLKEYNAFALLGPVIGEKSKYELKDKSFKSAKVLYDNGIKFAFMTDHPFSCSEYARTQAALFVADGLPYLEALKALTINAAKAVGLENQIGSIEAGKDADIVIYSGDPFHYMTQTELVMVNGSIALDNRK